MTAAHQQNLEVQLLEDAVVTFCPIVAGSAKTGSKPVRKNEKTVRLYGQRFLDRMNGDSPFQSEEEAIATLAPVAIWIFRWALRQLAIQVIRYLWSRWQAKATNVTVSAFARRIG